MIESKVVFELRDSATFIPIVATLMASVGDWGGMSPREEWLLRRAEEWLLRRAGYSASEPFLVLLTRLDGGARAESDPYAWGGRTYPAAHQYIAENWDTLQSGTLIDVRVLLGEATTLCESEFGL